MVSVMNASRRQPIEALALVFCAWKSLLLILAAFCPGPGYDTSALILLDSSILRHQNFHNWSRYDRLILNVLRWDGLYFAKTAERGHVFEQEWAFSTAYSALIRVILEGVLGRHHHSLQNYILFGIILSHLFHFISVIVLYHISIEVLALPDQQHVAFIASIMHILTPASLFYSAPYTEALFSLLNMLGMLCYARSKTVAKTGSSSNLEDAFKITSGVFFASANLFRSNGLLNGVLYLYDVVGCFPAILHGQIDMCEIRRAVVACIAGLFIAAGFIGPQRLAFGEFCTLVDGVYLRPWCEWRIPSIYSWVQSHYWNVGMFRYWTVSNIPLFFLAAPMLCILLESSVLFLQNCFQQSAKETSKSRPSFSGAYGIPQLVLPQLMLAVLAITSFHVQIVNRISSAYPIWYVMISACLFGKQSTGPARKTWLRSSWVLRGLIVYALIQGVLFANFLPPA